MDGGQGPGEFSFQLLEPDWEKFAVPLANGRHRIPALQTAKFAKFVNGPESFTPDNNFIMGETPELKKSLRRSPGSTRSGSPARWRGQIPRRMDDARASRQWICGRWTSAASRHGRTTATFLRERVDGSPRIALPNGVAESRVRDGTRPAQESVARSAGGARRLFRRARMAGNGQIGLRGRVSFQ